MRRMFEFVCEDGHISEALVDDTVRELACRACGKHSTRIVSVVRSKLEGISGAFPSAYDAWERKRSEKLAQERKTSYAVPE
jgi:hypothetical protein